MEAMKFKSFSKKLENDRTCINQQSFSLRNFTANMDLKKAKCYYDNDPDTCLLTPWSE